MGFITNFIAGARDLGVAAGNGIKNGVSNALKSGMGFKNVGKAISGGVGKVGSALNISTAASGVLIGSVALCSVTAGGIGLYNTGYINKGLKNEAVIEDNCAEEVEAQRQGTESTGDHEAMQKENAWKVWSFVVAGLGGSEYDAAGILGCMTQESGVDPTTVETMYGDEDAFTVESTNKLAALGNNASTGEVDWSQFSKWACSTAFPKYHNGDAKTCTAPNGDTATAHGLNLSFYCDNDGGNIPDMGFCVGTGLVGFTGPHMRYLVAYADSSNGQYKWFDLELQLAAIFDEDSHTGAADKAMAAGTAHTSDINTATINFLKYTSGGNVGAYNDGKRQAHAQKWYNEFHGKAPDTAFAQSILDLADSLGTGSLNASVKKAEEECAEAEKSADNSSIAEASVAFAWPTKELGEAHTEGTELQQAVADGLIGLGYPFDSSIKCKSCDYATAQAILWSGSDDDYQFCGAAQCRTYMEGTGAGKWQKLGEYGSVVSHDDLQPGDVFINPNDSDGAKHIFIYVSNDIVQKKYPGNTGEYVHASHTDSSAAVRPEGSYNGYLVYRCVNPDKSDKCTGIVEGMNCKDGTEAWH